MPASQPERITSTSSEAASRPSRLDEPRTARRPREEKRAASHDPVAAGADEAVEGRGRRGSGGRRQLGHHEQAVVPEDEEGGLAVAARSPPGRAAGILTRMVIHQSLMHECGQWPHGGAAPQRDPVLGALLGSCSSAALVSQLTGGCRAALTRRGFAGTERGMLPPCPHLPPPRGLGLDWRTLERLRRRRPGRNAVLRGVP